MKKFALASYLVLLALLLLACRDAEITAVPIYITATSTSTTTPVSQKANFSPGWITFTNANESIDGLAFDQDGHLWAASTGGLVKWDISNGTYKKYTTADGLPTNRIATVFVAQSGTIWVGTPGSISSFDGNKWEIYENSKKQGLVSDIFQDSNGKLWFVGDGINTFDGEIWETYTTKDGLGSNSAASVIQDNQHNIWLGTWFLNCGCEGSPKYTEGVSRFNGHNWDVLGKDIGLDDNEPASGIQVNAMAVDDQGGIWFGTAKFGAIYFDGKQSKAYTIEEGLSDDTVTDIKITKDGTVWFATLKGITSYNDNNFNILPETKDLAVLSLAIAPNQSLWFGTNYGIFGLRGSKLEKLTTNDQLLSTSVTDIDSTKQGAVWLGTNKGAIYTDGNNWQFLTEQDGLPNNEIKLVRIASDGTLWIGTRGGLAHLVDKNWIVYLEGRELYDLVFDNSNGVWVGSYGMYYFDGAEWTEYIANDDYWLVHSNKLAYSPISGIWTGGWGVFSNFDGTTWISHGRGTNAGWDIRALTTSPEGAIWVASELSDATFHTETGFKSFDGSNWKLETKLNLRDVTDMDFSEDGTLWVATREGAYKYDGIEWTHYTIQDGLAGNVITSIHVAGDGAVWFATGDGLTRFAQ